MHFVCHTGLDCNGTRGKSFSARLKRELSPRIDFWHCLCHKFSLGLNDALDAIKALKDYFVPHLRMVHSEFKRSSNNRRDFKALHSELCEFDTTYKWKIFYPKLFCLTRWLGFQHCADILATPSNRELLKRYAQQLRDRDFGPRPFNPYRYQRRRGARDAHEAGGDDRDGEDSSSDEEVERVQEALAGDRLNGDGYQPAPQLFPSAEAAAASAPKQRDLTDAEGFDEGDVNVRARSTKCKNMLNKDVGLTNVNAGRSAYLAGALKPYKVLIESLQRFDTPQQHLVARWIRRFYMVMKNGWVGTARREPMYASHAFQGWINEMMQYEERRELVKLVKKECRAFCSVFLESVKNRLAATWDHIQALELIDPLGPELEVYATPEVWEALEDLCDRRGLDFAKCQEQILDVRAGAESLDETSSSMIRMDLCSYFRYRHSTFVRTGTASPTPDYDKLCQVVFSIPLTSAFVESLFSKMAYNQSKYRARLKDSTMTSILHVHDAVLPDPQQRLPNNGRVLKAKTPRCARDKMRMNEMIGDRVCQVFEGERFHGEITAIRYHEVHAQYMYHVEYEDGDGEDYWRHEIEMIRCTCEDSTTTCSSSSSED